MGCIQRTVGERRGVWVSTSSALWQRRLIPSGPHGYFFSSHTTLFLSFCRRAYKYTRVLRPSKYCV